MSSKPQPSFTEIQMTAINNAVGDGHGRNPSDLIYRATINKLENLGYLVRGKVKE